MNKTLSKAVLTIAFSLASLSATAEYNFTLLNGVDDGNSYARSINDLGQIVGHSLNPNTTSYRATLWNDGVATDIYPHGATMNFFATSINNSGQIVGHYNGFGTGAYSYAMVWNDGVGSSIIPQGSVGSVAYSINDMGHFVGYSATADGYYHATLWNNEVATQLTNPQGSTYSDARSINNLGQIVGFTRNPTDLPRATVWNNGVATKLANPQGSDHSYAFSINDLGQIVGYSRTLGGLGGYERATIWDNGVVTDMTPQGSVGSYASSINDLGQVVGYSLDANTRYRATLWDNGVATDLNSFLNASTISEGWILGEAFDINDNGDIVGDAYNTVSNTKRAFLLQSVAAPVPEADTSAMLLIGLGVMGVAVRRRKNTQA